MAGNGMFEYVLWKNVDEYQRFYRKKDARDIPSASKKYRFGEYCVVGLYNHERRHSSLDKRTPFEVFSEGVER